MEPEFNETVAKNLLIAFIVGCGIDKKDIKDSDIKIFTSGKNAFHGVLENTHKYGNLEYDIFVSYTNTDNNPRIHVTTSIIENVGYFDWDDYCNTISELNDQPEN